jgi:Predicted alternative thymidylate synthase
VECSRACHTQFIRHRLASYWSESQRYVDYSKRELRFVVPAGFPEDVLRRAYEDYLALRRSFKPEYARMALPNAAAVRFAVQMNARELLLNFVPLRCAAAAQAEIRHVCWQIFAIAWRLWPTLAKLVWQDLPQLHRDFCTKVPEGQDCRLYAIEDAEKAHAPSPRSRGRTPPFFRRRPSAAAAVSPADRRETRSRRPASMRFQGVRKKALTGG